MILTTNCRKNLFGIIGVFHISSEIKHVRNVKKAVKYRDRLDVFMLVKRDAIQNRAILAPLSQKLLAIVD